jgi:pyruvate dehydrogenase E2 component (dihydrolipoamide acetyltransferase)
VEVPSPYAGTVATLHAAAGETVDVGKPLITVATGSAPAAPAEEVAADAGAREGEAYRAEEQAGSGNVLIGYGTSAGHGGGGRRRRPRGAARAAATPAVAPAARESGSAPVSAPAGRGPVRVISPLVRRLAHEHGIDLHGIEPTGYRGIITKSDVQRAIEGGSAPVAAVPAAPDAPAASGPSDVAGGERRIPLNGFRKAVSVALSRSRSEIPEATVWVDVDTTPLWELRDANREGPGLLAYLARFVVAGLKAYPVLNARLDVERDEIVEYERINLGVAVQGDRGLVVPAVMGADAMTTTQLDGAVRELTGRAREGRVSAEELAAGTFTLNNYGSFRVDGSAAIINHPQVAILGFGRIIDRPWGVDGRIELRKITTMSFVFDHRVCDGGTAAGFMRSVADAIENPAAAIARL